MLSRRPFPLVLALALMLSLAWVYPAHGQKSLQFAEPGDYALIPHDPSLAPTEITVEVWIRVHSVGDTSEMGAGGEQSILDKRDGGGGYQFRLAGDAFPLGAGVVAEPNLIFTTGLVFAYRWHHLALTQDADSMSFYFDGELVYRMENAYQSATSADLFLGDLAGCVTGCLWLRGEIDDLRMWDHARTRTEINDTMHAKLTGNEPGLVGYWSFDEDSGSTITDATANGNDGTLYGNAALVPSDAPVGFTPLPAPTGIRTYGEDDHVRVLWKPLTDPAVGGYGIFRADTLIVPTTQDHLVGTVSAAESTYVDATAVLDQTHYYVVAPLDTNGHLGTPTQETAGRRFDVPKDYLVGVYYWPSRRVDPWWSGFYVRDFFVPKQPPALGHYDSSDPAVIDQHLDWMQEYGIDFLACEWLGQAAYEDSVLRTDILPALVGRPTRFTVLYHPETLPDIGNIDPAQEDQLVSDFTYIADKYFDHPNILRFDGRPVVFIYRSLRFGGAYVQAFDRIRSELLQRGHDIYLVGDEIRRSLTPDVDHMQFVDAITMWRSVSRPTEAGGYLLDGNAYGGVARFMSVWHRTALAEGKGFVPCFCPGVNARQLEPGAWIAPRESQAGAGPTSQLEEQTRTLRSYIAPQLNAVMIWSWNHWESDSQIEPSVVAPGTSTDVSGTGEYTGGYTYTGYGTQCLELIQSLLGFDPGQVVLEFPPDAAVDQARRPTLAWDALADASAYHVQVATASDFSDPVVDQDLLAATELKTDTLAANTSFHWRVRAQSGGGSGAWSVPFTFTTGTRVPVRLASFSAEREAGGSVIVRWEVLDTGNRAGFHVYRAAGEEGTGGAGMREVGEDGGAAGNRVRLTDDILSGYSKYAFTDDAAPPVAVAYWLQEIDRAGQMQWHGPAWAPAAGRMAWTLRLTHNRPNPVRSATTLSFTVPAPTEAVLQILDLRGRVVAEPFHRNCGPGPYEVVWDGRDHLGRQLPNGLYFYRLVTGQGTRTAKLVLLQ
jgi:hypothetical protein